MRRFHLPCIVGLLLLSVTSQAQHLDRALDFYKEQNYAEAALGFYDVLRLDARADTRDQAEIYLADTLNKLDLWLPALFYYSDVFNAGKTNRYYLNAVEGLLALQETSHDPIFVANILLKKMDAQSFGQLPEKRIAQINFLVGELLFRKGQYDQARLYLESVQRASAYYPKAVYLLGLVDTKKNQSDEALMRFKYLADSKNEVKDLATLAAARTAYGLGRYQEAASYYAAVPRMSDNWFDALYEDAWARFRNEEYGKAMGELSSVASPYFAKRHIPEAYVILGTTYFVNCQWDRVRSAVDQYKSTYEPMTKALTDYLAQAQQPENYYRDIIRDDSNIPLELARQVRRQKHFKDYYHLLTHMTFEQEQIKKMGAWQNSNLAGDLATVLEDHKHQLEQATGIWTQSRLRNTLAQLQNFNGQIAILDFEVADAERQWLEQGREILKGRRARLPRPNIPNDQWQHWNLQKEFWKDEIGYYQYSMRTECE